MSHWPRGEAEIERLIASNQLQQVAGGQANGEHLLESAARTVATASEIAHDDPDSAYVLAYDAARYAATALLAQQGLRPTTSITDAEHLLRAAQQLLPMLSIF